MRGPKRGRSQTLVTAAYDRPGPLVNDRLLGSVDV